MKKQAMFLPDLHLRFKVVMPETGDLIHEHDEEGHSWTRNAWNAWNMMMMDCSGSGVDAFGEGVLSIKRYSSNIVNHSNISFAVRGNTNTFNGYGFYNNAPNSSFGILVGSGGLPFLPSDYCLYNLIDHGSGAGQLSYAPQSAPVTSYNSNDKTWSTVHIRVFNNNSGATIVVREVGLVYYGNSILTPYALMARDVLETPIEVPNGGQLTVEYLITTQPFTACEEINFSLPELGAAGHGGYYIGQSTAWPHPTHLWLLIASPIGGQLAAGAWCNPAQSSGMDSNAYGYYNTEELIALGAVSPLGQKVSAYRAQTGIADWYVPAHNESEILYINRDFMPAGHGLANDFYWSSSRSASSAGLRNYITNTVSHWSQTTNSLIARLVRRISIWDWDSE